MMTCWKHINLLGAYHFNSEKKVSLYSLRANRGNRLVNMLNVVNPHFPDATPNSSVQKTTV